MKKVMFFLLLALAGVFFVFKTAPPDPFLVRDVDCKTQYGPCSSKDLEKLESYKGANLFLIDTNRIAERLLSDFGNGRVYVYRVFPAKLAATIAKKRAFVAFARQDEPDTFLVSADGTVLSSEANSPLPTVYTDSQAKIVVGAMLDKQAVTAAKIVYLAYKAYGASSGQLAGETLTIQLPDQATVYFPLQADPEVLIGALQLIHNESKMQGKLPRVIDLRYSNPVLRY